MKELSSKLSIGSISKKFIIHSNNVKVSKTITLPWTLFVYSLVCGNISAFSMKVLKKIRQRRNIEELIFIGKQPHLQVWIFRRCYGVASYKLEATNFTTILNSLTVAQLLFKHNFFQLFNTFSSKSYVQFALWEPAWCRQTYG